MLMSIDLGTRLRFVKEVAAPSCQRLEAKSRECLTRNLIGASPTALKSASWQALESVVKPVTAYFKQTRAPSQHL